MNLRHVVGGAITAFVWITFVARAMFGSGPLRDSMGRQAPLLHYFAGALIVTFAVALWIALRERVAGRPPR